MSTITKFEDIQAWQAARKLTRMVFQLSAEGLFSREFALRDQIRRAAISVMSNIAEGYGRNGDREFILFLGYAAGSANEVQSQLYIALDCCLISKEEFESLHEVAEEAKAKIGGFLNYLRKNTQVKSPKT